MSDVQAPTEIGAIAPWSHDEAMALAEAETAAVLELVCALARDDWSRPTECPGWAVRDVVAHLLGMWKLQADSDERSRQLAIATERSQTSGRLRIDELTALQVAEHVGLSDAELAARLRDIAPQALAARRDLPEPVRMTPYDPLIPGETGWTIGHLFDVIHTRDPWMHRVDICRATGREMSLSAEHDGRIVAEAVGDWWRRHGQPVTLKLTGPAGGVFTAQDGPALELDAVEFCRVISGRGHGDGLLSVSVTF
jgi:uncharacterized protein (TIGR03083 family)